MLLLIDPCYFFLRFLHYYIYFYIILFHSFVFYFRFKHKFSIHYDDINIFILSFLHHVCIIKMHYTKSFATHRCKAGAYSVTENTVTCRTYPRLVLSRELRSVYDVSLFMWYDDDDDDRFPFSIQMVNNWFIWLRISQNILQIIIFIIVYNALIFFIILISPFLLFFIAGSVTVWCPCAIQWLS